MKTAPTPFDPRDRRWLFSLLERTRLAEATVLAYCLWQARDLIPAWLKSPYDRLGWLALIIWLLPVLYQRRPLCRYRSHSAPLLLGLGLALSCIGVVGSLNLLNHLGLATTLAGLAPASSRRFPWAVAAVSWIPFLGWIGSHWFPSLILPVRLLLAAAGSGFCLLHPVPLPEAPSCPT